MDSNLVFGVLQAGGIEVAIPAGAFQEVVEWPGDIVPQILGPEYVLGTFNLRGSAVPTVDLRRLMRTNVKNGGRIVILQTAKGRLGLAVDDIADVVRTSVDNLHPLNVASSRTERPLVRSLLLEQNGARIIQVLDIDALTQQAGVSLVAVDTVARHAGAGNRFLQQFLFFDCDDFRFCLAATAVREVIKRPDLDRTCQIGGVYQGFFTLRGEAIPVVDLFHVLALPSKGAPKAKLLVLEVRGSAIALPVTDVVSIQRLTADHVMALPGFGLRRPGMFQGVVTSEITGKETLMLSEDAILLSHEALAQDPDVAALRRVHDGLGKLQQPHLSRGGTRTALLGFQAGETHWTYLQDVQEITTMPARHVQIASPDGIMLGLLKRRGTMVPMISFRRLTGQSERLLDRDTRVLLVRSGHSTFAFIVDGVTAIEHVFLNQQVCLEKPGNAESDSVVKAATRTLVADGAQGEKLISVLNLPEIGRHLEQTSQAA